MTRERVDLRMRIEDLELRLSGELSRAENAEVGYCKRV